MLILILTVTVVVALLFRILLRNDLSPTARLAWIMVVILLPLAGGIIYFLFGEINLGFQARDRSQVVFGQVRALADRLFGRMPDLDPLMESRYQSSFHYAASINGFVPVTGNAMELMPDAATARSRLIEDIDAARKNVHVLYYIWLTDETGRNTAQALIRAAKRGVACKAMADGLGSKSMIRSPLWQEMREAGVEVAVALPIDKPIRTILKSRLDLRNHRKITVIDNHISYCGSQNCADPEFLVKARFAPWVDIMLRVTGPVVSQNQLLFASDWIMQNGGTLEELTPDPPREEGDVLAQIVGDGPTERRLATPHLFSTLLHSARDTITISTPYFVPDTLVLEALCAAAYRGVKVMMIFPKRNDSWIVAAASHSNYRRLLQAGITIREFTGGLLHAKTLTIDGKLCFIGSSNMDLRSFDLNYENDLLIYDSAITGDVHSRQIEYSDQSEAVTMDMVDAWPYRRRIWNNVIATIGPVL